MKRDCRERGQWYTWGNAALWSFHADAPRFPPAGRRGRALPGIARMCREPAAQERYLSRFRRRRPPVSRACHVTARGARLRGPDGGEGTAGAARDPLPHRPRTVRPGRPAPADRPRRGRHGAVVHLPRRGGALPEPVRADQALRRGGGCREGSSTRPGAPRRREGFSPISGRPGRSRARPALPSTG